MKVFANAVSLMLTFALVSDAATYEDGSPTIPTVKRSRRLTTDGRFKASPAFSGDGQQILYTVRIGPQLFAVMRLRLADGVQERIDEVSVASQFDVAISPNGRYLCFAATGGGSQLVMVIRDTEQKKDVSFNPGSDRMTARRPSFSADGHRIALSLSAPGGQQIATLDLDGKNLVRLTDSAGINGWPAFGPDGRRIAFASSRDGDFDIYAMDADGKNLNRLTQSPGLDLCPQWSPDGKRLAFTSNRDGNYEVYLMNADGTGQRNLTNSPERDDFPRFAPDGKRLVMVCEQAGAFDLYLLDASTAKNKE